MLYGIKMIVEQPTTRWSPKYAQWACYDRCVKELIDWVPYDTIKYDRITLEDINKAHQICEVYCHSNLPNIVARYWVEEYV